MRTFQNLCLLIGATALGAAWGCIAITVLGAFTVFRARSGEDWGTSLGMLLSGACFGAPLGAIAGFQGARLIARDEREAWSAIVWIGVALGFLLGPVSTFFAVSNLRPDFVGVLIVVVVTVMFATVGGMLATSGERLWRRASMGRSRSVAAGLAVLIVLVSASVLALLLTMLLEGRWTVFEMALAILIGVPILCGMVWRLPGDSRARTHRAFRR